MLSEYFLEDGDHAVPLPLCNTSDVREIFHRTPVVLARPASDLTDQGGHVVLQIGRRHTLPRSINRRVRIEEGVWHEGVDELELRIGVCTAL